MLETKKYILTVEGETEQWYFLWLRDQINKVESQTYNASILFCGRKCDRIKIILKFPLYLRHFQMPQNSCCAGKILCFLV